MPVIEGVSAHSPAREPSGGVKTLRNALAGGDLGVHEPSDRRCHVPSHADPCNLTAGELKGWLESRSQARTMLGLTKKGNVAHHNGGGQNSS